MKLKLKRFRLTQQVITVFIVAVFIPLIIAGFLLVNINQQSVRKELNYSAKVTLDNINNRLISSIETAFYNLQFLSNLIANDSLNISKEEIESLMEFMVYSIPQIKSIEVYTSNNTPVLFANPEKIQTFNFLDFDSQSFTYVQKTKDSLIITLYTKIPDNTHGYKVLKANLDNKILQELIFKNLTSVNRYIRVINSQGNVVFAYPEEKTEIDINPDYAIPEKILKETKVGEVETFGPYKNQPAIFYNVPDSNLSIVIYTPERVTYEGIIKAREKILLVLFLAAAISILIGSLYVNAINRNIKQIIKAVYAVSIGKYRRKIRLIKGYFTPYELVFLAEEFNKMATKIDSTLKDLQEANSKLSQLDKFKSNLIDTVSHELRTPLTCIKGYTSRLLRTDVTIPEDIRKKSLIVIKEQADRLNHMVDDLLVIPELEKSISRVYIDEVDILPILERSVESFKGKYPNKEIITYTPERMSTVSADAERLEQVIMNLLSNAIKYSYEDSKITINIELLQKENKIMLEFINECDPIPEKALETLFEKFKRLDDNLTRTTRGSGLGLYISKGLIEAMNSEIYLEYKKYFKAIIKLPVFTISENNIDAKTQAHT